MEAKWDVKPEQVVDFLALMGDSSDNVPGVAGIGKKTAVTLLQEYGDLDTILSNADSVKNKRPREGLLNGSEAAHLSKELVTIKTDLPISTDMNDFVRQSFDFDAAEEMFRELEFVRLLGQLNEFRKDDILDESSDIEKNYQLVDSQQKLD